MLNRFLRILPALGVLVPGTLFAQPAPAPAAAPPTAAPAAAAPAPAPSAVTTSAPAPTTDTAPAAEPVVTAPAEPPPAFPPVTEPAPVPAAEAAPAEAPAPEYPKKMSVGTEGLFTPGVLLQGWFQVNKADETTNTFKLRRAELAVKGEIIQKTISYALMMDFAKVLEFGDRSVAVAPADDMETVTVKQPVSAVSALQDFFITYQSEYIDVSFGQFKIPVSWEGYNSSSKTLYPERAPVARLFGDKRDIGLRLAKSFEYFGYSAGIFNGAGQNTLDNNKLKDGALRLEAYPIPGFLIGVVGYSTLGDDLPGNKNRIEGDLRYEGSGLLLQAEYIRGRDVGSSGAATKGHGFYFAAAYAFLDEKLQPALRIGYIDPNTDTDLQPASADAADEYLHFDVGLNYYILKQETKLQLVYSRTEFQDKTAGNEVILATQLTF